MSKQHEFLKSRGMRQGFIVMRIDDYESHLNERGAFSPAEYMGRRGGYLWMTQAQAEAAAKHVGERTGHQYGVFKMVSIVEEAKTPFKVTQVG